MALVLAAMGVYSVLAHAVTRRTQESGVRIALGASPCDILGLVIGRGLLLAGAGVGIGVGCTLGATRPMSGFLHAISPSDLGPFIEAPALLGVVAPLACYMPARRATKLQPMVALRAE